jgi:hypothetical protein
VKWTVSGQRFANKQITSALSQAESRNPEADGCWQLAVIEATFYLLAKKYEKLDLIEFRELR